MADVAPEKGQRLRVLFEDDGWDYGKIVDVAEGKDQGQWDITVVFDGEDEEDKEVYTYPDEDIVLQRDAELLFKAMNNGDVKSLKKILSLSKHLQQSRESFDSLPASQHACTLKNAGIIRAMLEMRLDPNHVGNNGESLLHTACYEGSRQSCAALIDFSADLSVKDARGRTPLHAAASVGNVHLLNALLGPMYDTVTFFNSICGSLSEMSTDPEVILNLNALECPINEDPDYEAKVDQKEEKGGDKKPKDKSQEGSEEKSEKKKSKAEKIGPFRTALHVAVTHGHKEFVSRLCELRADVTLKDKNDRTPLHFAAMQGNPEIIKVLIEAKADLHAVDKNGHTPFIVAAAVGKLSSLKAMYKEKGRDWHLIVNKTDSKGMTALSQSCRRGHRDLAGFLLNVKADPNTKDIGKMSPLHWAVMNGDQKIVEMLMDSTRTTTVGESCYFYFIIEPLGARYFLAPDMTKPVEPRQGAQVGSFVQAVEKSNGWLKLVNGYYIPMVEEPSKIDKKSELKLEDRPDPILQPFLHSIRHDPEKEMKKKDGERSKYVEEDYKLTDLSKTISLAVKKDTVDITGRTALHLAAIRDELNICGILLDGKADINARDDDGITPLYLAANENKARIVKLLLSRGADFRIPREDGWTPLHVASAFAREDIVRLLLDAGANSISRDKFGAVPLKVLEGLNQNSHAVGRLLKAAMNNRYTPGM